VPAAILYPGLGLHETPLSVGRGTDRPFEMIGAPYIDEVRLVRELRGADLPGVSFVPVRFTPTYSTFKGRECGGAAFVITDREKLNAVDLGIELALVLQRFWPGEYALNKLNTRFPNLLYRRPPSLLGVVGLWGSRFLTSYCIMRTREPTASSRATRSPQHIGVNQRAFFNPPGRFGNLRYSRFGNLYQGRDFRSTPDLPLCSTSGRVPVRFPVLAIQIVHV